MNTLYLRSMLWLIVATAFLFSCSKVENDQIQPKASTNTNAHARVGAVLYEQLVPAGSEEIYTTYNSPSRVAEDFVVPATETWTIEAFQYYHRLVYENTGYYHVDIYKDAGGLPGEIIFTHLDAPAIHQTGSGFSLIDITDIELSEGTYWISLRPSEAGYYYVTWSVFRGELIGGGTTSLYNFASGWKVGPINLAFTLYGTMQSETTIEDVISTFNTDVIDGKITGAGKGKTATNNLNAFKNMLNNAKALLAANDLAGACTQLTDAQKRIHTGGTIRPDHFITGSSAGALNELITELKTELGCL
jgi:hypothetical protein